MSSGASTIVVAILLVVLASMAICRVRWRPAYVRRSLMTPTEQDFFHRLEVAAEPGYVFPQVAMSALIAVKQGRYKNELAAFRKISQKRVDYAIFDTALRLACVIELDDRSHDAARDRERDALLASAGIPTIRWDCRRKPTVSEIKAKLALLPALRTVAHEKQGKAA